MKNAQKSLQNLTLALTLLVVEQTMLHASAETFDHSHAPWTQILAANVDSEGLVDYPRLQDDNQPLDNYLEILAAVSESDFKTWTEPQQVAFLVNLYNAATLRLVRERYPIDSIKQVGGLFKNPWKLKTVPLFGQSVSLDHVEHERLRVDYSIPEIHFALVCAAKGCPPLRQEAYTPDQLDQQLRDQGHRFMKQAKKNRIDPQSKTVFLSPIFKWFQEDFVNQDHSLMEFVLPYFQIDPQNADAQSWRIRYTDYDWSLNNHPRESSTN